MKLNRLLRDTDVQLSDGLIDIDTDISSVTCDSQKVQPGGAFVCVAGLQKNGHAYIGEAVSAGAKLVVLSDTSAIDYVKALGIGYAFTPSPRRSAAVMCSNLSGRPAERLKIFAVTGTNGKTTVTKMLESIYKHYGAKTGVIGTLTGKLTTPDPEELYPILKNMADTGATHVFMEASSHALALEKLAPIKFDYGIFTNLTPDHLDFHGTMESYFLAKKKLFDMCYVGVINYDDPYSRRIAETCYAKTVTFSAKSEEADFYAANIKLLGAGGIDYELRTHNKMARIRSVIPGKFTVFNTLAAASCAMYDGVPTEAIRNALTAFRGVKGRLEKIPLPHNDYSVFIDFAHTPDALENVLRTVRGFIPSDARLTVLFGCGGDRDRTKRKIMGAIASRLADFVIVTSDNSRSEDPSDIISEILRGIDKEKPFAVIEDRREAIRYAIRNAEKGECIILSGKGHEEYEINSNGCFPFSEREIVLECIKEFGR